MIPPRFQAAIDHVLPDLTGRSDVLAVFLSGSFLRGQAGPTSDVDLYVAVSSAHRQRRQVIAPNGTLVEIFVNPIEWIRRSFQKGDFHAMHMIGSGVVLWTRDASLATALRTEARDAHRRGPAPPVGIEWEATRYGLLDSYEDALDAVAEHPSDAAPALWRVLDQAIAVRYRTAGRWPTKDKWLLVDLETWDPSLASTVRAFYAEVDPNARLRLVETALRVVLGPDDDLKIRGWESEPALPPE